MKKYYLMAIQGYGVPRNSYICMYEPVCKLLNVTLICCVGDDSDHVERERCSRVHLDAITSDDAGNIYAFRSEIRQQTTICFQNWFPIALGSDV